LVPLRRHFRRASTPSRARRLDFRHPGANQAARSVLVVSHHLDGLLRSTDSGVLQPVPARVRRVSPLSPLAPASWPEARRTPPRDAGTPRRTFIISSCTTSLQPLPSCDYPSLPRSPIGPPKRTTDARDETNPCSTHRCKQLPVSRSVELEPGLTARSPEENPPDQPSRPLPDTQRHHTTAPNWEANFPIRHTSAMPKHSNAAHSPRPRRSVIAVGSTHYKALFH